jgi:hypothetical protein
VPSTKKTFEPSKRSMFGLDVEVAVAQPGQQVVADRGVCLENVVVGLGQAVVGHPADRDPQHGPESELLQRERTAREGRAREVVGRDAEEVLRQDVRPAAHREIRLVGHPGRLHRDVGGGVADAEHHDPLAANTSGVR